MAQAGDGCTIAMVLRYPTARIHWGVDVLRATGAGSFALTTSPGDYVSRPDTERALVELEEWVLNAATSSIWITGPPGMGKTLLLKVLADRLSGRRLCVYVAYPMLAPKDLAAWVLDALGGFAGDTPEDQIVSLAEQHAQQGGLLLLVDDANSMPPATRSALDSWHSESNGSLRSVLAGTDSSLAIGANASLGDARVTLDKPLSFEEARAVLAAALERSQLDVEALVLFDPAMVEELHERAGGVPTRLLIQAGVAVFIRSEQVRAGTSAPSASALQSPPKPPTQPAAVPAPKSSARPRLAPQTVAPAAQPRIENRPAAPVELPDVKVAEQPSLLDLILEPGPVRDGGRNREQPPVRAPRRHIHPAASYAGVLAAAALAMLTAIQLMDGEPEPSITPLAAEPVIAQEKPVVEIGPGSIEFERYVAAAPEIPETVAARPVTPGFDELPAAQTKPPAPELARATLPSVSAAGPTALAPRATSPAAPSHAAAIDGTQIVTEGVIRPGEWLAASFRSHDIPMPILNLINREVGNLFDFTRSQPGDRYSLTRDSGGELVAFRYVIANRDELRLRRTGEHYTATLGTVSASAP